MALIPAPGVAQSVMSGMIGANPWAVVHHWKFGSSVAPWVQSDADLLATTVMSAWNTALKTHSPNNVDVRQCSVVDLTSTAGVGSLKVQTPSVGSSTSTLEPSSLATVATGSTGTRYRGGHPRTFWPLLTQSDMVSENAFNSATTVLAKGWIQAWITAVSTASYTLGTSSLTLVVPRYTYAYTDVPGKHKYTKEKNGFIAAYLFQNLAVSTRVGAMRRRLSP